MRRKKRANIAIALITWKIIVSIFTIMVKIIIHKINAPKEINMQD